MSVNFEEYIAQLKQKNAAEIAERKAELAVDIDEMKRAQHDLTMTKLAIGITNMASKNYDDDSIDQDDIIDAVEQLEKVVDRVASTLSKQNVEGADSMYALYAEQEATLVKLKSKMEELSARAEQINAKRKNFESLKNKCHRHLKSSLAEKKKVLQIKMESLENEILLLSQNVIKKEGQMGKLTHIYEKIKDRNRQMEKILEDHKETTLEIIRK